MDASLSLPELVAAAQANAAPHEQQIAQTLDAMDGQLGSEAQREDLRAAAAAIELLSVDIFAVFEARMQHHFKRGPFSRKLKALLTGAGQPDLSYKIYHYYLAINVLKHGIGSSHRELLKSKTHLFTVEAGHAGDLPVGYTDSLIDVAPPAFFEGLTTAILDSYHFLER